MEGGAVGHNLKGTHPGTIPARFGLIWFSGFRGDFVDRRFLERGFGIKQIYLFFSTLGGSLSNCVRQRRPVSKMATVTKNRNFFKWSKLLYFKPECAQI
jgi:hypothetical protein